MKTFERYLQDIHAQDYHGTDDDMPDDFERWLTELQVDDLIEYAEQVIKKQSDTIEKLLKLTDEAIAEIKKIREIIN